MLKNLIQKGFAAFIGKTVLIMTQLPLDLEQLLREKDYSGVWTLFLSKLPTVIAGIAILVIGFWLANLLGKLTVRAMRAKGVDQSVHGFIRTIMVLLLKFIVILTAMSKFGININSFIAAVGAAGVTAGLGLQESVSQFASGITILINKPFKSGDFIELENVSGKVLEIRLMYTTLVTLDNKRVIVPNSHITTSNLVNYNAESHRRIDLVYSVSYDTDIALAKDVLTRVVSDFDLVLKDPAPLIAVKEHGASAVMLTCYVWCNSNDYWDVYFQMQERVKIAFDQNGISIPFDQLDVHIRPDLKP